MKRFKLDPEEKALERSLAKALKAGKLKSVPNLAQAKASLRESARVTLEKLRKTRRVNIRMSESNLLELQNLASIEGIPYQTLISSILHKYVNGSLVPAGRQGIAPISARSGRVASAARDPGLRR